MLTRFVRIQLAIFTIASIVGVAVMVFGYMQVPTLLGIGRITVRLELPATGGLYRFANVTYRGVHVGKVTAVGLSSSGVKATLSLGNSPRIPADLTAVVGSMSAVGEQYVDLQPRTDSSPYLRDGSVIAMGNTTTPQQVGPLLDQVSALIGSIPKDKLSQLLDDSFRGFNGSSYDLGSLSDSAAKISADLNSIGDRARTLTEDAVPLVDSQAQTTDSIRTWARSLAGVSQQVATDDPQVRTLLRAGPNAADEASRLLNQIKPTLPVLLANLTSIGQVAVTYNPSLEQLLVLLPPYAASLQAAAPTRNPTGIPLADFHFNLEDPPVCTVGYLPPSQMRSPADTSTVDTPDGLYCKLPQDSPVGVRGVRNYPCMGHPGKRAPTVEICDSDKPFEPLALREHVFGAGPLDPNLLSQGVPPDDMVTANDRIFGPVDGTPLPPGAAPSGPRLPGPPPGAPPSPPGVTLPAAPIPPQAPPNIVPPPAGALPPDPAPPPASGAAPSSFRPNASGQVPPEAAVHYDPQTGKYLTPDGRTYQRSELVTSGAAKTWQDLILDRTSSSG
ncbi:MAG TPA: MlaD family protein [Mycobacterium sp.]|nr:MlaD family protein [Mycobacterium sp.]